VVYRRVNHEEVLVAADLVDGGVGHVVAAEGVFVAGPDPAGRGVAAIAGAPPQDEAPGVVVARAAARGQLRVLGVEEVVVDEPLLDGRRGGHALRVGVDAGRGHRAGHVRGVVVIAGVGGRRRADI